MASGRLLLPGWMPARDSDGAPIPNVSVYFYVDGTTSLASVFADEALTVPLTNPVYANASGRFPQIYASDTVLYSASVDAPYGPAGQPFTFEGLSVSISANIAAANLAQGAAEDADQALQDIEELIEAVADAGGDAALAGAIAGAAAGAEAAAAQIGGIVDEVDALAVAVEGKQNDTTQVSAPAQLRTDLTRWKERSVSVREFSNLVVDGDWSYAINAALALSRRVFVDSWFLVKRPLSMRPSGNFIEGTGVAVSGFDIDTTFTAMSSDYILKIPAGAGESHAGVNDIGFRFYQPDAGRASFIQYPYAIDMRNVSRALIGNIRISGAKDGINMAGNSGGLMAGRLEIGAFNIGINAGSTPHQVFVTDGVTSTFTFTKPLETTAGMAVRYRQANGVFINNVLIPGVDFNWVGLTGMVFPSAPAPGLRIVVAYGPALDFWHVDTVHSWPFGFQTAAQLAGYWDGNTISMQMGRVDGVEVKGFSHFAGKVAVVQDPVSLEGPFGNFGVVQGDSTYARWDLTCGRLAWGSAYFSASGSDLETYAIRNRLFSVLTITSMVIAGPPNAVTPFIQNSSRLNLSAYTVHNQSPSVALIESTDGPVVLMNGQWIAVTNQARTAAAIRITGGQAHIVGNQFARVGTGGGKVIEITQDDRHCVMGNTLDAWDLITPAADDIGLYGINAGYNSRFRSVVASDGIAIRNGDDGKTIFLTNCVGVVGTIGTVNVPAKGAKVWLHFDGFVAVSGNSPTIYLKGGIARNMANNVVVPFVSDGSRIIEIAG